MRCSRCKGKVVWDKMFDLPRKILEYYCINCGERFWMEKPGESSPPLAGQEGRPGQLSPDGMPSRLMILNN